MRRFDLDLRGDELIAFPHLNGRLADLHLAPLPLEAVETRIVRVDLLFKDVGGIGPTGGHRHRRPLAVSKGREGDPQDANSRDLERARVDAYLVEPELPIPAEVGIDHRNRGLERRSGRGEQHLVRSAVLHRVRRDPRAPQVSRRLPFGPAPDDVAPQGDHLRRVQLRRPGRHLGRVLLHVALDPLLVGLNRPPHRRTDRVVPLPRDLCVAPQPLAVVMPIPLRPKGLRHRPFRLPVVAQQLLEAVLRLGIPDRKGRILQRRSEDVGNPELVPHDLCRSGLDRPSRSRAPRDDQPHQQDQLKRYSSAHRSTPLSSALVAATSIDLPPHARSG